VLPARCYDLKVLDDEHLVLRNLISYKPVNKGKKIMKVFMGGKEGIQIIPFKAAWSRTNFMTESWTVEYISVTFINESDWTPKDLVDWLLDSHVHVILSHIHQGIAAYLQWDIEDLKTQLQRLKYHLGFPNLNKLNCPVFLQDKYEYLNKLPMHKVNNTLQIFLTHDDNYYSHTNVEFMERLLRYYYYIF